MAAALFIEFHGFRLFTPVLSRSIIQGELSQLYSHDNIS